MRRIIGPAFLEVWVRAPGWLCESRDVKGMYARARAGDLKDFTGVDAKYEAPEKPDIEVRTIHSIESCVAHVIASLR
jgi:adenylylsulfate kinase